MRKMFALMGLMAFLAMPTAAMANDMDNTYEEDSSATLCSYCWEKGEFTTSNPEASRVLLFPIRMATGTVGAPVGALKGLVRGGVDAVEYAASATFGTFEEDDNAAVTLLKAPIIVPVGIVTTAAALPLGMTYGAVTGTFKGFAKGYMYPDSW